MRRFLIIITSLLAILAMGQERILLNSYDETNSQLQGHITMVVQGQNGMLWLSTWNGLCRFDGYDFVQFKPQPGDGCTMTTDRLRDVWTAPDGSLYCLTDDGIYRFDTHRYRFCDLSGDNERQQAEQLRQQQTARGVFSNGTIEYTDPQGLLWRIQDDVLACYASREQPAVPLAMDGPADVMVRCAARDAVGRLWIGTRQDATLRLYDSSLTLIGYVGPTGRVSKSYQSFGATPYCFTQTADGDIWIGCKPEGLFRLRESPQGGSFDVRNIARFDDVGVYDIKPDNNMERLWIATLGAGVQYVDNYRSEQPRVGQLPAYPKDACQRVRHIHLIKGTSKHKGAKATPDLLLATTTEGLVVGRLSDEPKLCEFHRHTKDPERPTSLSCNATMDIAADVQNRRIFVSTETGGLCELLSNNLWDDTLSFRRYDMQTGHLPSDMLQSVSMMPDGRLLLVGNMQFTLLDLYRNRSESFGHRFLRHPYRFSEARPLLLGNAQWLFPTHTGIFTLRSDQLHKSSYRPPLVLTKIQLQGGGLRMDADALDTLTLAPDERSLTIHFAALDYKDPTAIRYQFCLGNDSMQWTNLADNRSVTLLDLKPGTYNLYLRSTNADGQLVDNTRHLTIVAKPSFWETPWPFVLLALLVAVIVGAATYTLLYIRRINRQRRLTLAKYLALVERTSAPSADEPQSETTTQDTGEHNDADNQENVPAHADDPFVQSILDYVEQNMSNSEADIGQMAEACAVSRSVLQRKMKSMMGVTPADFLREARLKHACQLLRQTSLTVSEVAYRCGFSDPKYFSRCFKLSVGLSPSDYKSSANGTEQQKPGT